MGCNTTEETSYKGIPVPEASKMTTTQKQDVMVEVIDTLLDSGLPNMNITIACGIAGNIDVESGFNYTAVGDHGTSYGLCQWHETRLENLYNYCKQNNLSYTSVNGQVKFLINELQTSYKNTYNTISSPEVRDDISKVASNFCMTFERPKNSGTVCPKRAENAKRVYEQYSKIKAQQS